MAKFILINGAELEGVTGQDTQDLLFNVDEIVGANKDHNGNTNIINLTMTGSSRANSTLEFNSPGSRDRYWDLIIEATNPLEAPSISRNIK